MREDKSQSFRRSDLAKRTVIRQHQSEKILSASKDFR